MTDHDRFERLLAFPNGHTPEQRAALEIHLHSCPTCRATQAAYRRQDVSIRALPAPAPLPGFRQGVRGRIEARPKHRFGAWRPAIGGLIGEALAGAVVALIIAGLVLFRLHSPAMTGQKPTVAGNPSGGTTFCVMPGERLTTNEMQRIRTIVAHRLHDGLGIKAPVRITGGSCVRLVGVDLRIVPQAKLLIARGSLMVGSYARTTTPLAPGSHVSGWCILHPSPPSHPGAVTCHTHLSVVVPDSGFRPGSVAAGPAGQPRGSSVYWVTFRFTPSGSRAFCRYTTRHIGKYVTFVLDTNVVSDPMIDSPICGGQGEVIVGPKLKARMIAAYINYGPLPARLAGRWQISTHSSATPGAGSVPPAAQQLATRLGIHGTAHVGDDPGGVGGPWAVWFPRKILSGSVGSGNVPRGYPSTNGPALFTGPQGAKGEFHYFNEPPLFPAGTDKYNGPPLTRKKATTIAMAWLHRAGAPIPPGPRHVLLGGHMTNIGGTGICCYKAFATVYWGKRSSFSWDSPISTRDVVYVADRGVVVEMDIGAPPAAGAETPSHPCKGDTRDGNGVALGRWCFDYPQAAHGIIFTEIGGHDGLILQPDYATQRAGIQGTGRFAIVHRISLNPLRGTYLWTLHNTTYKITVVPAFPGLVGSTWYVQSVQVQRHS